MIYSVVVKGAPPPDLARKIAEAHVEALKSTMKRSNRPLEGGLRA